MSDKNVDFAPTTDQKTEPVLAIRLDWALKSVSPGYTDGKEQIEGSDHPHSQNGLLDYRELHLFPRHHAERKPDYLQIIPYAILFEDGQIYGYQRQGSEDRLVGKGSIGFGGHVSFNDVSAVSNEKSEYISPASAIRYGLRRELQEEVGVAPRNIRPVGSLYDPSDEVGRVHLGIVYMAEKPSKPLNTSGEIASLIKGTPEEVFEEMENPEGWTKIIRDAGVLEDYL